MNVKRIYVIDRNPSLQHHEFGPRWKIHSELAQQFPELVHQYPRLAYCATREQDAGIPGASRERGGVGMLWLRSRDLLSAQPVDPAMRPTMQADELRVFTGLVMNSLVTVDETVLKDGRGARFCLISFLRARPGLGREEFIQSWRRQADALLDAPEFSSLVQRYAISAAFGKASFEADGMAEMWFNSVEDAVRACNTPAYRRLVLEEQEEFAMPAPLTLLTDLAHAWSADDCPFPLPFP
jgi:hypothetical protein